MTWSKLVKKSCGLIVFSILTVFGDASEATVEILPAASSSLAVDGQDSSPHLNALNGDDHDGGQSIQPDKRAYTYVSEFKRLPLYNFGVGKRFDNNMDDDKVCYLIFWSFNTFFQMIWLKMLEWLFKITTFELIIFMNYDK